MYNTHNITTIRTHLLSRGETLSVAESVTSGHLQAALSQADGAALFFQGGITAYNLGQKSRHLQVDPIQAQNCNCVSEKIAEEMAAHVCSLFSSDWGIAITGYAALVPELNINYLFAYYAFGYRGHPVLVRKIESRVQPVLAVQQYYTDTVLEDFVQSCLQNQHVHNHARSN